VGVEGDVTAMDAVLVLFAVLLSSVVVETVLVALRVVVPTVVVNVCTLLWPGVRVPTVKVFASPLDRVTPPVTANAAVPADASLVKVTVPLTTEPAGALAGSKTVLDSSAYNTPLTLVSELFVKLLSATLGSVTLAVTVPPAGTLITALVADCPAASVTGAKLKGVPLLTTICGVKVTAVWPAVLDRFTVACTVLPGVPPGIEFTDTPGSAYGPVVALEPLFAVLLSGVTVATVLLAISGVPSVKGIVAVKVRVLVAPGARLATVKVRT